MSLYARVLDNLVRELFFTDADITTLFHPDLVWVNVDNVIGIAEGWTADQVGGSWKFKPYTPPPPTPEQILSAQNSILQYLTQQSTTQKAALTERVGTLNDAIELEMATEEEEAELPVRVLQLKAWKTYGVLLGRVTAQSGWPTDVQWPVQPTEGM